MTNEELKKKIINLLDEATGSWYEDEDGMFAEGYSAEEGDNRFKAHVADALIAAGLKFDVSYSFTAAFNSVQAERERDLECRLTAAEHRAAGAEKELLVYKEVAGAMLCEIGCSNEGYCPEFYKDPECKNCTKKKIYGNFAATSPCLLDKYIQQAEKELAEEGKDEQS